MRHKPEVPPPHHSAIRRWVFDEDHFYLVYIGAIVIAVTLLLWHPWG